jgi:hypothetical protein
MTEARSNAIRSLMQAMDAYGDDITFGQMIDAVETIIRADEREKTIGPVLELLHTQRVQHAALIGSGYPVLIEVDRVLALLEDDNE